jgi:hypothetical protein
MKKMKGEKFPKCRIIFFSYFAFYSLQPIRLLVRAVWRGKFFKVAAVCYCWDFFVPADGWHLEIWPFFGDWSAARDIPDGDKKQKYTKSTVKIEIFYFVLIDG